MVKFYVTFFICCMIFTLQASTEVESMQLSPGLWEGISSDKMSYQVLEITEKGQHRFISAKLTNGFKNGIVYSFHDQQVKCSSSECIVDVAHPQRSDELLRLILTPYLDEYFTVLHIHRDQNGRPVLTEHYRLSKQTKKSTVTRFLDARLEQLKKLKPASEGEMDGVWIGVMNSSEGSADMVLLEFYSQQMSIITRYINGTEYTHVATFKPEDVSKRGEHFLIRATHPIKDSNRELTLHRNGDNFIEGYWSDSLRGQIAYAGSFRLYHLGK